ncbi:MAG: hypothetical protein RLY70_3006 [Planctomycetota bacterium]|jgi:hypothetical protein
MNMNSRRTFLAYGTMVLASVAFTGCGGGDGVARGNLQGKVTLKAGSLPAGCTVAFSGGTGGGSATIDSSGAYKLSEGIPVGSYRVSIVPPATSQSPEEAMKAAMSGKAMDATGGVPAKYLDPAQSGLTVDVKAGDNTANFELSAD